VDGRATKRKPNCEAIDDGSWSDITRPTGHTAAWKEGFAWKTVSKAPIDDIYLGNDHNKDMELG